jgi:Zn-dependent protease
MDLFIQRLFEDPLVYLVALAAAAFGLVMHNVFQAFLADRYRDGDPKRFGFMSLEPKVHFDGLGLLFLAILGFGFPNTVPFRLSGTKAAQVALMGPLGFAVMAFVYLLVSRLLALAGPAAASISAGLELGALLMVRNAVVFIFPVPPLDGARVAYAIGNQQVRRLMDQLQSYGFMGFFMILLLLKLTGVLSVLAVILLTILELPLRLVGLGL